MNEFLTIVAEVLISAMPDSDAGKVWTTLIVGFVVLVVTGRFKLEWIGQAGRHIFRWLRCKIRDKHYWQQAGIIGWVNWETGRQTGTFVCRICGKVEVRR